MLPNQYLSVGQRITDGGDVPLNSLNRWMSDCNGTNLRVNFQYILWRMYYVQIICWLQVTLSRITQRAVWFPCPTWLFSLGLHTHLPYCLGSKASPGELPCTFREVREISSLHRALWATRSRTSQLGHFALVSKYWQRCWNQWSGLQRGQSSLRSGHFVKLRIYAGLPEKTG